MDRHRNLQILHAVDNVMQAVYAQRDLQKHARNHAQRDFIVLRGRVVIRSLLLVRKDIIAQRVLLHRWHVLPACFVTLEQVVFQLLREPPGLVLAQLLRLHRLS